MPPASTEAPGWARPSDLVRVAMAAPTGAVDGVLAGGPVMSIATGANGLVVAVASNIAHADTPALARRIADAVERTTR